MRRLKNVILFDENFTALSSRVEFECRMLGISLQECNSTWDYVAFYFLVDEDEYFRNLVYFKIGTERFFTPEIKGKFRLFFQFNFFITFFPENRMNGKMSMTDFFVCVNRNKTEFFICSSVFCFSCFYGWVKQKKSTTK